MPFQIFLDTNIQVYAAGRPHELKQPCLEVLRLAADYRTTFITDAEVLQELLHRYLALRSWEPQGRESFASFTQLMEERVEPIYTEDVEQAARLVGQYPGLDARDLLHTAVMQRLDISRIISADGGFDQLTDIERLDPADVASWRRNLTEGSEQ